MVPSPPPARVGVSSSYESPKDPGLAKLSSRGTPRTPLLSGGSSVSAKSTQPVVVAPVPPIVSLPVIPEPVIITSSKPNSHTSSAVSLHGVPSLPPPQYPVAPVSQLAHSASTASSTHSQPHNPPTDHNTAAHPVNAVHAAPHNHPEPKHNAPDHSGSHQHAAHNPVRHGRSPRASSESLTAAKSVYVPQRRSSNASNASGRSAHPPPPLDTHTDGTRSPVADSAVPLPSLSSPPLTTHAHPPAHAAHAAPHYALPTHAHPAQGPHPQPHPTYAHDVLPQLPTPMHVTHSQPGLPSDALPHYALPTHAHPVTEPPPAPTHSSEPVTSQPYASHAHPSQPHAQSMHAQSVHAQSLHGQRRAHGQQGKPHRESHPVPPTVEARIREEAARVRAATTIQVCVCVLCVCVRAITLVCARVCLLVSR